MRYRKKPVVIEAEQFFEDEYDATGHLPKGVCDCVDNPTHLHRAHIHTLEGIIRVAHGDWVITGIAGERYPCKATIFAQTYEPAEESTP